MKFKLNDGLGQIYSEATPRALKFAIDLLKLSALDIEASQTLYDQRSYSLAVYHLQQAVEKAMKAMLLINGLYTKEEVKNFHHKTFKAFVEQWKKTEVLTSGPNFTSPSTKSLMNQAKMAKDHPEDILRVNNDVISHMLEASDSQLPYYIQRVREQTLSGPESDFLAYGHYKAIFELGIMGLITYQHEACTRYPGGIIEPSDYTDRLGIVMALPELLSRLKYIVPFLEYIAIL